MKIKHWQGYGCVTAKKIAMTKFNDKTTLHIQVIGNHECGLHRDDEYDLFHWLVKRFDKSYITYMEWHKKYPQINITDGYQNNTETCDYIFTY